MGPTIVNISKNKNSYSISPKYDEFITNSFLHVQKTGITHCTKKYVIKNRVFNSILVAYVLKGKGTLEYNGELYSLNKKDLFVINCNFPHSYYPDPSEPMSLLYVHYAPPEIGIKVEVYTNFYLEKNSPVVKNKSVIEKIVAIINKIYDNLKEDTTTSHLDCSLLIYEIVVELLKLNELNNTKNAKKIIPHYIYLTKDYIENNYTNHLCIESISNNVSTSSYHLIREFKKHIGYTPYEYLLQCKFEESKNLLINTNLTISEIANKLNFSSSSHFITAFTKREKISPLKFRQKNNMYS